MKALISGQAGVAVIFDSGEITSFHIDALDEMEEREEWQVESLFRGMTDTEEFENLSREQVVEKLESSWRRDRCLPLILILMDKDEDTETRQMAAEALSELLTEDVSHYLGRILYAEPLPDGADLSGAIVSSSELEDTVLVDFLVKLEMSQPYIRSMCDTWDSLPLDLFDDTDDKSQFRHVAINAGVFHMFVTRRDAIDDVLFELFMRQEFRGKSKARSVFQILADPLRKNARNQTAPDLEPEDSQGIKDVESSPRNQKWISGIYERVDKQTELIMGLLTAGAKRKALQWLNELIDLQHEHSEPKHIVKTLCNIAQHAKFIGDTQLQLDLSKWAVEEMPTDGRALTQLGDAYRALGETAKALEAFSKAASYGEECVAMNGKAGLLKDAGKLDQALMSLEDNLVNYPTHKHSWNNRAGVLKELGRLTEALEAYDETITRFPGDPYPRCGRAEVLRELGRLPEALDAYERTTRDFPDDVVARCGRSEVLKELGRLPEALVAYDETISDFPRNDVARNGRAEVLKRQGALDKSLEAYSNTIGQFPNDRVAKTGKVSVLILMGQLVEALEMLPKYQPATFDDWVDYHIRGMAYLKWGNTDEAYKIFKYGVDKVPFARHKTYFQTALAMAMIRKNDFKGAIQSLPESASTQSVAKVVQIHAFGALGEQENARSAYESVKSSNFTAIVEPRDELAGRFVFDDPNFVAKSDEWLFERECNMLLVA